MGVAVVVCKATTRRIILLPCVQNKSFHYKSSSCINETLISKSPETASIYYGLKPACIYILLVCLVIVSYTDPLSTSKSYSSDLSWEHDAGSISTNVAHQDLEIFVFQSRLPLGKFAE